jgi:hypothetical protein
MKKISDTLAILLIASLVTTVACHENKEDIEQKTDFEKFAQKFAPPLHIQQTIENNKEIVDSNDYSLIKGEDRSAHVFAKGDDIARIIYADGI